MPLHEVEVPERPCRLQRKRIKAQGSGHAGVNLQNWKTHQVSIFLGRAQRILSVSTEDEYHLHCAYPWRTELTGGDDIAEFGPLAPVGRTESQNARAQGVAR